MALDRGNGAIDVGHGLSLGGLADQDVAILGEGNHRGGGPKALCVSYNLWLPCLQHGYCAVGGS